MKILVIIIIVFADLAYCRRPRKIGGCTPHPSSGKRYDAVVFDFFGTLADPFSTTTEKATAYKLPKDFVGIWRLKQLSYSWLRTIMGRYRDYWEITRDSLDWTLEFYKINLSKKQRNDLLNTWVQLKPYPDVDYALDQIQKKTKNIYVFSNEPEDMLVKALKFSGLKKYFKRIISADDVKTFKPSPESYAYLAKTLCINKEKLLFVTGNNWNAQGAKSYGFPSVWINRNGNPSDFLDFQPDGTYSSLSQFVLGGGDEES